MAVPLGVLAVLALGCSEQTPSGLEPAEAGPQPQLHSEVSSPDVASFTADVVNNNTSVQKSFAWYPVRTLVEKTFTGAIDMRLWEGSPYNGRSPYGPAGSPNGTNTSDCRANTYLLFLGTLATGGYSPAPCGDPATTFVDTGVVFGTAWFFRNRAPSVSSTMFCGTAGKPPCLTVTGNSTISLRRLDARLVLHGDTNNVLAGSEFSVKAGTPVLFRAGADPATIKVAVPFSVVRWRWVPDVPPAPGTTTMTACNGGPSSCFRTIWESGTMEIDGYGNGMYQTARAHVMIGQSEVRVRSLSGALETHPAGRGDSTLALEVGVFDASGFPMPNQTVTLSLAAEPQSGGHVQAHVDGRPAGTFSVGTTVNTGPTGLATVTYTAPAVGGLVDLHATAPNAKEANATLAVAIRGLVVVPSTSTGYDVQYTGVHSTGSMYLTPEALSAISRVLGDWVAHSTRNGGSYPLGGTRFLLTAASLEMGGLLDVGGDWAAPYSYHRSGNDVDFDDNSTEQFSQLMARHCDKYVVGGQRVRCDLYTGSHYHAYVGNAH